MKRLALTAAPLLLAGCVTMQAVQDAASEAIGAARDRALAGAGVAPTYRSMLDTELAGLFRQHPVTDGSKPPLWPRVALSFTSAPKYATQGGYFNFARPAPGDCVQFDATLWTDATHSRSFTDLKLCADYFGRIQGLQPGPFMLWPARQAWPFDRNSGSVRGSGPLRPVTNAPLDPSSSGWFKTGAPFMSFLMATLHQLGYDWNDLNDRRVWVVSVPAAATVSAR